MTRWASIHLIAPVRAALHLFGEKHAGRRANAL
jgi:hypothetical protein